MSSVEELVSEMRRMDRKFKRACEQVILLNNRLKETQTKYDRAVQKKHSSFRYHSRLRQVTLEGVRIRCEIGCENEEYANRSADRLDKMQDRLMEEFSVDWDEVNAHYDQYEWKDTFLPRITAATHGPSKGPTPSQKSTSLLSLYLSLDLPQTYLKSYALFLPNLSV